MLVDWLYKSHSHSSQAGSKNFIVSCKDLPKFDDFLINKTSWRFVFLQFGTRDLALGPNVELFSKEMNVFTYSDKDFL